MSQAGENSCICVSANALVSCTRACALHSSWARWVTRSFASFPFHETKTRSTFKMGLIYWTHCSRLLIAPANRCLHYRLITWILPQKLSELKNYFILSSTTDWMHLERIRLSWNPTIISLSPKSPGKEALRLLI